METKSKHNLEKTRLPNMMVGFSIVAAITLATFSYGTCLDDDLDLKARTYTSELTYEEVENIKNQPIDIPKTQETQPQQTIDLNQEIKIVDNKNENQKETVIETINVIEDEPVIIEIVEPVVDFPDIEADFPGGEEMMRKWMQENIVYPDLSIENGEQGKVYLNFVVEKDGSLTDIKILRDAGYGTGKEAERVLKKCPKWVPGEQNGKKVRVLYSLPISLPKPE